MLEKEIEKKLIEGIHRLGGRTYKWVSPGHNGVPDRIVIMPGGKIIFVDSFLSKQALILKLQRWIAVAM